METTNFETTLVDDVTETLQDIHKAAGWCEDMADDDGTPSLDVRLQVTDVEINDDVLVSCSWDIHEGLADYDDDHSGSWGASSLVEDMTAEDIRSTAEDLVRQAVDSAFEAAS